MTAKQTATKTRLAISVGEADSSVNAQPTLATLSLTLVGRLDPGAFSGVPRSHRPEEESLEVMYGLIAASIAFVVVIAVAKLRVRPLVSCVLASFTLITGFGAVTVTTAPPAFADSCPGLECQTWGYTYGGSFPANYQPCTFISTDINDIHGSPDMWTYGSVDAPGPGGCHNDGTVNSMSYLLVVKQNLYKWENASLGWGWVGVNNGPWVGDLTDQRNLRHEIRTEYAWRPPNYYGSGYYSVDAAAYRGDGFTWYGGYKTASWTGWIS